MKDNRDQEEQVSKLGEGRSRGAVRQLLWMVGTKGECHPFLTPISLWRVLCEWKAVVTAPLLMPS